ncbi:MAG: hypothetical protein OZ923_08440 [Comamonadaceae bacterium]|nr:hypothetical protein [Burkholderiales bacterium]MEB2348629.1 hypothetical protein [Comamonadaceae bacterium]
MGGLDISPLGLALFVLFAVLSALLGRWLGAGWRARRREREEAARRASESRQARRARERQERKR